MQTSSAAASDDSVAPQPDAVHDVTVVNRDADTSSQAYEPLVSEQPPAREPAAAEQPDVIDRSESTDSSDSEGYTHLQVERETSAPAYESLQGEGRSKKSNEKASNQILMKL